MEKALDDHKNNLVQCLKAPQIKTRPSNKNTGQFIAFSAFHKLLPQTHEKTDTISALIMGSLCHTIFHEGNWESHIFGTKRNKNPKLEKSLET